MGSIGERLLPVVTELETLVSDVHHDLPPALESAAEARRVVREVLQQAGRSHLADAAELAVSEVVTNALLHAHTNVQLWVGVGERDVCVEVRDFNSTLPVERGYDAQASTGRGMGLVAALASTCGVHTLGDDGKVVWFRISDDPPSIDPDDLLAAWAIDEPIGPLAAGGHEVALLALPTTLWLSAHQHHDALLREFVLYQAARGREPELAPADQARTTISTAVAEAVDRARAAGTAEPAVPAGHPSPLPWVPKRLDLQVTVPAEAAALFAALQDVLDAAERLAVTGELLTRPALPEITALRDWACEQVIAQIAGNAPAPWPGTDQERFERGLQDRATPELPQWDSAVVAESPAGAIAADDANRIVAISRPLAAVLGWEPQELVGRRVVTVIPPALREAHVAGFSRHLSTGEAHVLGVPLDLPVLRKDGTEVLCRFLIERAPLSRGRAVYVAWIEPLEADGTGPLTDLSPS